MLIGDVAMPYVVGWRPFDDRTGGQKRFGAGEEVDDPRMWATLLEQHLGPPCFCRTRIPSCCVPHGSFTMYFRLFLCLPAPGESRHSRRADREADGTRARVRRRRDRHRPREGSRDCSKEVLRLFAIPVAGMRKDRRNDPAATGVARDRNAGEGASRLPCRSAGQGHTSRPDATADIGSSVR